MKTYKVKIALEGVKVGDNIDIYEEGLYTDYKPLDIAIALHLGFIEEVGAVKKDKFVPEPKENYWYISNAKCRVEQTVYVGWNYENEIISIGNCYRTEAEALEARERVLKAY